jgi:hypothetical protein
VANLLFCEPTLRKSAKNNSLISKELKYFFNSAKQALQKINYTLINYTIITVSAPETVSALSDCFLQSVRWHDPTEATAPHI